jgi:hypothetical protein
MKLRDDQRWGPLDDQTVAEFETRNGFELPADYRAFLLAHHGGVPDPSFYWVVPGNWGSDIARLYGFGPVGYDIQRYLDFRESTGIDPDLMAIGDDGCCSLLAIGIRGVRRGQVFFIDHELALRDPRHAILLASSFKEFLNVLTVPPDH